ncbi:hypothetical protein C4553_01755 [Candidatus Parcubacteria bacterium]|nr:MAG: hypothetical protein C4553_01755 [Candidatus Parcubacteria bacterium]
MQLLSILEPPSKEALQAFAKKRNIDEYLVKDYHHPQEDFLVVSETPPVFVVSDGVTLNFNKLIETKTKYPNPSPAGDVSKIFCQAVVQKAKEKHETLGEADIAEIFKYANNEVGKYNEKVGKSDIAGNPTGYYAATGSFVIIKNNKAYWASICDSYVAFFDNKMNSKFMSSGSCRPYAVINGEERMVNHVEKGVFNLENGDYIFVFTDGFADYVKNKDFSELFKNWDKNLKESIAEFSKEMNLADPEKYGHERSLIAVLV